MFSKKIFSERFIKLRQTNNLNQSKIAEILGISQAAISKIEKGERAVSIEVLCSLADYFDVPLDYLTGRGIFEHWEKLYENREVVFLYLEKKYPSIKDLHLRELDESTLMQLFSVFLQKVEVDDENQLILFPKI